MALTPPPPRLMQQAPVAEISRTAVKRQRSEDGRRSGNVVPAEKHAVCTERRLLLEDHDPLPSFPDSPPRQSSVEREQVLHRAEIGQYYEFNCQNRRGNQRFVRGVVTKRWCGSKIEVIDIDDDKQMKIALPPLCYHFTSVRPYAPRK